MSKIVLLVLFVILLAPLSTRAQKRLDRDLSDLKGLVQTVRDEEADIEFEKGRLVEGKRRLSSIETYTIDGSKSLYAVFTDNGKILWRDTYIYDSTGLLIEQRTERSPFTYLPDRKVFTYDEKGNLIVEAGYDSQNELLGKYTYIYDAQGYLIEEESAHPGNKLFYGEWVRKHNYDDRGNRIEMASYQREGSELKPYDSRLGYYKQIYLYDSAGRQIAANYIGLDERLYRTHTRVLDDKGNEVEGTEYNADGSIRSRTKYAYKFDKQGNWIKQTTSEWVNVDGRSIFRPTEVTYRTITYFKSVPKSKTKQSASLPNVLQNTETEDYLVYAAILNQHDYKEKLELLVIKRFTEGFNTDTPNDRKSLTPSSIALAGAEQETVDDYVEKNQNRHYQLLDQFIVLKGKHALISDDEINKTFAKRCDAGWAAFYNKYRGSHGITTLSKVGFNKARTQAVVYVGTQSRCLAGEGHLIILAKESGAWRISSSSMLWVS